MMEEPEAADVSVIITNNGPYVLLGFTTIDGVVYKDAVLCRCGRSGRKPFCDGSHLRSRWDAEETWDGKPGDEGEEG